MSFWLSLAFIFAALEIMAVSRNLQSLEYIVKPAVLICLFLWLYSSTDLKGNALWFGLGLVFSLVGDVLLIASERLFLFGLIAFLLAHICYIIGFLEEVMTITVWSLILAIIITISISRLLRRIVAAMQMKGQNSLVLPVSTYATVISLMLYTATSTLFNPLWKTSSAFFVSLGALLFCISDAILAWNKFVSPVNNGRVLNITLYYLGQMGLIAGVISQFGK